jgi:hypothetical protein
MKALLRSILFLCFPGFLATSRAADYPAPNEADFVARDFHFTSGEIMPQLRLHYRTLGKALKDSQGVTQNAVLIIHGTTGSGAQFFRPEFAGELFGAASRSMPPNFLSFCPTASVTANRANRAMGCTQNSLTTATATW